MRARAHLAPAFGLTISPTRRSRPTIRPRSSAIRAMPSTQLVGMLLSGGLRSKRKRTMIRPRSCIHRSASLHAKTFAVDRSRIFVGSFNSIRAPHALTPR